MSNEEDNKRNVVLRVTEEIISNTPKELRLFIGMFAGMYIIMTIPMLFIGAMKYIGNLGNPEEPSYQCWQIQKVEAKLFELNTCTGEVVELPESDSMERSSNGSKK
jgi:hypothetical protein